MDPKITPATGVMTSSLGVPVDSDRDSVTAGEYGPMLISDIHYLDKIAKFDRERIPERVVHAKGTGVHGYFKVTHDITKYTKAKIFESVGKVTPMFVRFSLVSPERGGPETARDPRGFAMKFYTEEGNWDLVANNTPIFFIRDPMKFPDFIHSQKRDPRTNLPSPNAFWDFLSLTPESTHQTTILFSDRGTPDGYRHMHGFGSHTFRMVNKNGQATWVKFHIKTKSGIKNLSTSDALSLKGLDADYAQRDMFNHIQSGKTAEYQMFIQAIPEEEAFKYKYNIFDVTKVIFKKDYPLIPVGDIVLDRNVENYFAETEQVAFSPGNIIPGIEFSPDKMLQGRVFSYPDTHRHRLGANFEQIPINCPLRATVHNVLRDGPMCVNGNQGRKPNYEPNSMKTFSFDDRAKLTPYKVTGLVGRHKPNYPDDDFSQARELFKRVMTSDERDRLIVNIAAFLKMADKEIQERAVMNFYRVDPEYGDGISNILGFPSVKSKL